MKRRRLHGTVGAQLEQDRQASPRDTAWDGRGDGELSGSAGLWPFVGEDNRQELLDYGHNHTFQRQLRNKAGAVSQDRPNDQTAFKKLLSCMRLSHWAC